MLSGRPRKGAVAGPAPTAERSPSGGSEIQVSHYSRGSRAVGADAMSRKRSFNVGIVILLMAILSAILSASPALAQDTSVNNDDLIILTGRADVTENETVADVVIFDGPVNVDGTVAGDIVAFNGRVTVAGSVRGDVVSFNGRVVVEDGAQVTGDVQSRPAAQISEGADVGGSVGSVDFDRIDDAVSAARFGVWFAFSISALILILAFVLLFPGAADRVAAADRIGAAIGWGLLLFFGLPIIAVLLLVTIVGIPLGMALLLAIVPLYALGYVASGHFIGRKIIGPPRSRLLAALVGIVVLRVLAFIPILGGLVWFAATVFGLGLLVVAARRRGTEPVREPVPAPA
jgi:hypothetical protein